MSFREGEGVGKEGKGGERGGVENAYHDPKGEDV